MKKPVQDSSRLTRSFAIFLAVIGVVSVFGGYQLSRMIYKMNDFSLQRADQLLVVEESLDQVAIALGGQIQEWKDMLLRAGDAGLYNKHRNAFMDASVGVQYALINTRVAMENIGMETGVIDQLSAEHKSLVSNYMLAHANLDPRKIGFSREVDKRVIGVDRELQQHIAVVRIDIDRLAQQQMSGAQAEQVKRYWLFGVLGAVALMLMALIGFIFASRFYGHETATGEHLSAS